MAQFFHSKIWAATCRCSSFVFSVFHFFNIYIIKQISVRWQHKHGISAVPEKCGSLPKSWCLSETDSHPFWPSCCNQAFLPKVTNSSQELVPGSRQRNNKLLHVWHVLFLHPSVCSSWDAALHTFHHRRRESSTKNCNVKCHVRPSAASPQATDCRLSDFIIPLGGLGFYMAASTTAE